MLPIRNPPQNKKPTETESEGLEKKIFQANGQGKESQGSDTYIRQSRLQNKGHEKRPRRTLHNMQGKNLPRKKMNIISIYAPNIGQPKI